ncbi:MAG: Eco57I restriction-modification methylase domain-containing protein [Kiritimatiellia bacterium]
MLETLTKQRKGMVARADAIRKAANKKLRFESKSKLGQFMTPAPTASFMASLFVQTDGQAIELLDPGAGVGSLSSAFLSRVQSWSNVKNFNLDAYEIDAVMLKFLNENLRSCQKICNQGDLFFNFRIISEDYILKASELVFKAEGLWKQDFKRYTHCIMNPPYKKIPSSSLHRKALRAAGVETVNLYSGFVALAVALLAPGGQLVAIIPRSFCNGPYYRPFREFLFKHTALKNIHLFESRNKAFKDDNVLQENVIIRLEKDGKQGGVELSFSSDATFSDLTKSLTPFSLILHPADKELFIHIPSCCEFNSTHVLEKVGGSLSDIGLQVSTGPIVDYRLKEHLLQMPEPQSVPLLYPCHFSLMETKWPIEKGKKPNAINYNEKTSRWLYPNGFYTVVRRFSSKEEKRRIVASVVSPASFVNDDFLGFENHLNVFHFNKKGVPEDLARGLAVYLNCKAVDDNFRRFSGHTQVNATDLRRMKYPDRKTLMHLGAWAKEQDELVMDDFDRQLEALINESGQR